MNPTRQLRIFNHLSAPRICNLLCSSNYQGRCLYSFFTSLFHQKLFFKSNRIGWNQNGSTRRNNIRRRHTLSFVRIHIRYLTSTATIHSSCSELAPVPNLCCDAPKHLMIQFVLNCKTGNPYHSN